MGKTRAIKHSEAEDSEKKTKIYLPLKASNQLSIHRFFKSMTTCSSHSDLDDQQAIQTNSPNHGPTFDLTTLPAQAGHSSHEYYPEIPSASPTAVKAIHDSQEDGYQQLTTDAYIQETSTSGSQQYTDSVVPKSIQHDSPSDLTTSPAKAGHPTVGHNSESLPVSPSTRAIPSFYRANSTSLFSDSGTVAYFQRTYSTHSKWFTQNNIFPKTLHQRSFLAQKTNEALRMLQEHLYQHQLQPLSVPATGPCLFYSISYLLHGDLFAANTLRLAIVYFIWEQFDSASIYVDGHLTSLKSMFIQQHDECIHLLHQEQLSQADQKFVRRQLYHYLLKMSQHLEYGTLLELYAAALLYQFNFTIWSYTRDHEHEVSPNSIFSHLFPGKQQFQLLYSHQIHYDPLLFWNGKKWTSSTPYPLTASQLVASTITQETLIAIPRSAESFNTHDTPNLGSLTINTPVVSSDTAATVFLDQLFHEMANNRNSNKNHLDSSLSASVADAAACSSTTQARIFNESPSLIRTHQRLVHKQATLDSTIMCEPPKLNPMTCTNDQLIIGVYNVNGHTKSLPSAQLVPAIIKHKHIDIFMLVDTRASAKSESNMKRGLKSVLETGSGISLFSTTPGALGTNQLHNDIGGLGIILSPRLTKLVSKRYFDPSGLGLAGGILLCQTNGIRLLVLVTYWPTKTTSTQNNTLWNRTSNYLRSIGSSLNPLQYVQQLLADWILEAHQRRWRVVLGGDFNSGYRTKEGTHSNLYEWSKSLHLVNPLYESGQRLVTRPYSKADYSKGTQIDHILINGPFSLVQAEIEASSFALTYSDHLPMTQKFDYLVHASILPPVPKFLGVDLKIRNPSLVQQFQNSLRNSKPSAPVSVTSKTSLIMSAKRIDNINKEIFEAAKALSCTMVYPKLQFWTPQMIANHFHQQFIVKALKMINKGERQELLLQLPNLVTKLQRRILALNRPHDPNATEVIDLSILHIDNFPIEDWNSTIANGTNAVNLLTIHLHSLQSKLRYRTRQHQFTLIGKYRQQNERLREAKRFKQLLNNIFHKYPPPVDEIILSDNSIISDPARIHDHLTMQLKSHHSLNTQRNRIEWEQLLSGGIDVHQTSSFNHIPAILTKAFQTSLRKHSQTNLAELMETELNKPITFDIFRTAVMAKAKDKSPGITGVTINMLQNIPLELLSELYDHMNHLWLHRSYTEGRVVPDSWLHRWIATIPKDKGGPIKLDRIRPISLYEVTRKIWTGIINQRITLVWENQKALHTAQYGYRRKRGTDTAILQLINLVEDADEFNKPFFLMGFDTKKAFDAVNKDTMKIAWRRLGIPKDIAEYLTELDLEGRTIVKSPHANIVYHRHGAAAVLATETSAISAESYVAQDGIGQGDSTSANAWTAIYDILLCMLDSNPYHTYSYQVNQQDAADIYAIAYADDLNTVSPSKTHLQYTIDLVSAFNAIMGFSFNDKLECGTNCHSYAGQDVKYHDHLWNPFPITIASKPTIKILGVPIDLANNWYGLEKYIKDKILQSTTTVRLKNVSNQTKALAYQMALIPSVIYSAKFLNRSIEEIRTMIRPVQTFLRMTQNLARSYPSALLYIPNSYGGTQFTDITMQIQKQKHQMIKRAINSDAAASLSLKAMISRCYRQSVTEPSAPLLHSNYHKSWLSSYVQQQHSNKLYLVPTQNIIDDPLINTYASNKNANVVDWIAARTEIDTIRDILYPFSNQDIISNSNYCINPNHPVVPYIDIPKHIRTPKHMLLIGRRYLTTDKKILEFRGQNLSKNYTTNLVFKQWIPCSRKSKPQIGTKLVEHNSPPLIYGASILEQLESRVYCELKSNAKGHITQSVISAIIPDNPPQVHKSSKENSLIESSNTHTKTVEIFTDASVMYSEQLEDLLFHRSKRIESITGGAVLMIDKKIVECISIPIPSDYIVYPDSYEAETLTLVTALIHFKMHINGAHVFTDSQALTRTVKQRIDGEYLPDHPLINTLRKICKQSKLHISWIQSHADKTKNIAELNYYEQGNVAADALTRHDVIKFKQIYPNISFRNRHKIVAVPDAEIRRMIMQSHKLLVIDDKQRILPFQHQIKSWKNLEVNTYLNNRTEHSTRNIPWKHLTLQLSNKVLSDCGFNHVQRSKLIYDKYANQQYNPKLNTCPFCITGRDTRDHLLECEHTALVRIRELTNLHIDQLPLSKDYWEASNKTMSEAQKLRQFMLKSINVDIRTRIGLFNPQQVRAICEHLSVYNASNKTVQGIKQELMNLLQITAKGIQQLIKCRNEEVYAQAKVRSQEQEIVETKQRKIRTNRFRAFELDEVDDFQIVTSRVSYHFPPITTFQTRHVIDNEMNEQHEIEGFKGTLFHSSEVNSNTIYEKFISSTIPSILWPDLSFSSPLQYNPQRRKFNICVYQPKLGELIYHERFLFLLKQGCKLLNVNGFQLIFEKLNQLSNHNQEAIAYLLNYQRIYRNIENISDLITFLNWYATDEITKQLEILYRWLITHPELDSNLYGTLNAPDILNIRQIDLTTLIEFKEKNRNSKKYYSHIQGPNSIQADEISQYQTNKYQTSENKLHEIRNKITDLLLLFNQNKETFRSTQINLRIKEEIIELKKSITTSDSLHLYHQYLLKLSLKQFLKQAQQQKFVHTKCAQEEAKQEVVIEQRKITAFFKPVDIITRSTPKAPESTHIFNSND